MRWTKGEGRDLAERTPLRALRRWVLRPVEKLLCALEVIQKAADITAAQSCRQSVDP